MWIPESSCAINWTMQTPSRKHPKHGAATAEWVIGSDPASAQSYVLHTQHPAFLAKVADREDDGVLSGLAYARDVGLSHAMANGGSLYDFIWYDEVPAESELRALLAEAERAIDGREQDEDEEQDRTR